MGIECTDLEAEFRARCQLQDAIVKLLEELTDRALQSIDVKYAHDADVDRLIRLDSEMRAARMRVKRTAQKGQIE